MSDGKSFGDKLPEFKNEKVSGCSIDKTKNPNEMSKYNASLQDMSKLVEGLDKFGKAEYKGFPGTQSGPILVVFRETHHNNEVKLENFNAFVNNRDYFNFLASEGGNSEIDNTGILSLLGQGSKIEGNSGLSNDMISGGFLNFSTEAIELYYGKNINTCGVDKSKLYLMIMLQYKKFLREYDYNSFINFKDNVVIKERNTLWLTNMRDILISGNNTSGKNFIPVVAGGAHADDLTQQAQNFGFKGVIIFTPKSY